VYAPVSGTVIEINDKLSDEPGLVNTESEGEAWFIKLKMSDESDTSDLMETDAYKVHCENEAH
jgi:glycine cleavage system H protein